jgi:predicted nucleic acid-binding protein
VILADKSVWIDYLRHGNRAMATSLSHGQIVMHSFVVAEIALGSLRHRRKRLEEMEAMLEIKVAQLSEVRHMVEARALYSMGIGLTDAHLLASCLMTPGVQLWTLDLPLQKAANVVGVLVYRP